MAYIEFMKIKMKETTIALHDGFSLKRFEEGKTYEVRDSVGCLLINQGNATIVKRKKNYDTSK